MIDLRTKLGPLELANPILVASGTFGYTDEAAGFVDFSRLGGLVPKTVTASPRAGNPPPRIVETASGMLNSIGLDNDGIDFFLANHLPTLAKLNQFIIVNVAGKTIDEFAELVAKLEPLPQVTAIELNLSCPNVSGGTDFAIDPEKSARVLTLARNATGKPLFAKLTPNISSVVPIVDAVMSNGGSGVTLINTVLGTAIDWRKRRPILSRVYGGLSGPAIKPVALRFVLQVSQWAKANHRDVPILAAGGIATADDVMEFLIAGARAVQVGTANFFAPGSPTKILDDLPELVASLGATSLGEIIGSVNMPS